MRVIPNYTRYEPAGGFRAPPESGVVCPLCCYDIGPEEEMDFQLGQPCHLRCLEAGEDAGNPAALWIRRGEERDWQQV